MLIAEQLRLAGVPTFPCVIRWDDVKKKYEKKPITPYDQNAGKGESWKVTALRAFNDPQLDWSSGVCGVPVPPGVVILDLDKYKGATRASVEALLGCALPWDAALVQNTISGGEHYAFHVTWDVKQADSLGLDGFDTRSAGKGFICTGQGYTPVGFGLFRLAYAASLPVLPDACRRVLESVAVERTAVPLPTENDVNVEQIIAALRHIDPGCSRAEWIRIGYALRHHFHRDEVLGASLFSRWSAGEFWHGGTPDNYVAEHIDFQWGSFKPEGTEKTSTIATLFYRAIQGGWSPPATFDASAAFGANPVSSHVFLGLLEMIQETGGDVTKTQDIIQEVRQAGCNTLQVALLAEELKNALKDAGVKGPQVMKQVDAMLAPQGLPVQHVGSVPQPGHVLDANTPMHNSLWAPMQTKGKDKKPKATLRNFEIMLASYGVQIIFDEIGKEIRIQGPSVPGAGVLHAEAALSYLASLANLNEYPAASVPAMIMPVANQHTINPVSDWIHSAKWDGGDHVGLLFSQITLELDEDPAFCEILFRKWLRGAYAIGTGRLKNWEHVLILIDPYGGAGKTRFLSTFAPEAFRKTDFILDPADRDSVKMGTSYWLVELGELDGTFSRSDQARLKAFLSMEYDEMRLAYGRVYLKYPRRTAWMGTVNDNHFLIDPSNNRRMWPMQVQAVNHLHKVNIHQVWAQVAAEVAAGMPAHLTPQESQILAMRNETFRSGSSVADKLSAIGLSDGPEATHYTVSEILSLAGMGNPTKADLNEAARWLRRAGFKEGKRAGKRGFTLAISPPGTTAAAFKPTVVK